jgi:Regulator of chromosome condensation (RCC1) repeat
MRTALVRAATIALGVILIVACSDQHRDLLAPQARPEAIIVINRCADAVLCQPNWVDVSAGSGVTCAVHSLPILLNFTLTASNLSCWGSDYYGMLGAGSTTGTCPGTYMGGGQAVPCSTVPRPVASTRAFNSVSVGVTHVCAVEHGTGSVFCWGSNGNGQLGFGTQSVQNFTTPTTPVAGFSFSAVSAGNGETCGLTTAQDIVCWGGSFGLTPAIASDGATKFKAVSLLGASNISTFCGLTTAGTSCTGSSTAFDMIGQATTAHHTCQISAGAVQCWGDNGAGQLGVASSVKKSASSSSPVQVPGTFSFVSTGELHSCAISGTDAFCWGDDNGGELGDQTQGTKAVPTKVLAPSGVTLSFTKISTGAEHTCAIASNAIWCWGRNDSGQLGMGTTSTFLTYNSVIGVSWPVKASGT